jgi:hypothetical protein
MVTRVVCAIVLAAILASPAAADSEKNPWNAFRFLIGDWVGEGTGQPGEGEGYFSLKPDLQGKVLIRRNHAGYPARGGRPAVVHDDLMVIYPTEDGKIRADYFDNEGHIIHYVVTASADKQALTFLGDAEHGRPRFRLSYTQEKAGSVNIKFEIAPPGKPGEFKTYLEGKVRRKKPLGK